MGAQLDAQDATMRGYSLGRATKCHSDAWRTRIVIELAKTPEGQRRLQAADDRNKKIHR